MENVSETYRPLCDQKEGHSQKRRKTAVKHHITFGKCLGNVSALYLTNMI